MAKQLSQRAYEILTVIDDHTKWEGDTRPGSSLSRYWYPPLDTCNNWSETLGRNVYISGSGDCAILRSFARKGLTKSIPNMIREYACHITEDGMIALERFREESVYVDGRFPD